MIAADVAELDSALGIEGEQRVIFLRKRQRLVGGLKNTAGGNGDTIVVIAHVEWDIKLHRLSLVLT
jgi:hypothetical protein